jgi:hypothetical protein
MTAYLLEEHGLDSVDGVGGLSGVGESLALVVAMSAYSHGFYWPAFSLGRIGSPTGEDFGLRDFKPGAKVVWMTPEVNLEELASTVGRLQKLQLEPQAVVSVLNPRFEENLGNLRIFSLCLPSH